MVIYLRKRNDKTYDIRIIAALKVLIEQKRHPHKYTCADTYPWNPAYNFL